MTWPPLSAPHAQFAKLAEYFMRFTLNGIKNPLGLWQGPWSSYLLHLSSQSSYLLFVPNDSTIIRSWRASIFTGGSWLYIWFDHVIQLRIHALSCHAALPPRVCRKKLISKEKLSVPTLLIAPCCAIRLYSTRKMEQVTYIAKLHVQIPSGFPLLPLGGVEYHLHAQGNIPDGGQVARLALLGVPFSW